MASVSYLWAWSASRRIHISCPTPIPFTPTILSPRLSGPWCGWRCTPGTFMPCVNLIGPCIRSPKVQYPTRSPDPSPMRPRPTVTRASTVMLPEMLTLFQTKGTRSVLTTSCAVSFSASMHLSRCGARVAPARTSNDYCATSIWCTYRFAPIVSLQTFGLCVQHDKRSICSKHAPQGEILGWHGHHVRPRSEIGTPTGYAGCRWLSSHLCFMWDERYHLWWEHPCWFCEVFVRVDWCHPDPLQAKGGVLFMRDDQALSPLQHYYRNRAQGYRICLGMIPPHHFSQGAFPYRYPVPFF